MTTNPEPLTPNQVVAYNLHKARTLRGWTQTEAGEALEEHLGVLWSKAIVSGAERGVHGYRIRPFDADELVAFSRTFELPLLFFFLPPAGHDFEPAQPLTAESVQLLETLLLDEAGLRVIQERFSDAMRRAPSKLLRKMHQSFGRLASFVVTGADTETRQRLSEEAGRHHQLADQLEYLVERMDKA